MDLKNKSVLILEDSSTQALLLKETLEKKQLLVRVSKDGIDGLQLLSKEVPDLIISDIEMPRMDGYAFCKQIKSDSKYKDIPVILLTNLTDPIDVIRGMDCGADGFLTKPCEEELLFSTIHNTIKNISLKNKLPQEKLTFFFGNQTHSLLINQVQITELLLSTYSSAIQKNLELEKAYQKLNRIYEELEKKNKKLDADLNAAVMIQQSFLPPANFKLPSLELASVWMPANLLGGDIFNTIQCCQGKIIFYMIDVSGHDVPSALVTVSVSQYLNQKNSASNVILSPKEMMNALDKEYPLERFDRYFTIFYIILDVATGKISYSSAGHPPAVLLSPNKGIKILSIGGTIIGLHGAIEFEEGTETLSPGDKLILYTDGIIEKKNMNNELYGSEKLYKLLEELKHESVGEIVTAIQTSLQSFGQGIPSKDDISILAIEFKGE